MRVSFTRKTGAISLFCLVLISFAVWRWMESGKPSPEPIVLTIWHNPGSQARHAVGEIADEFNRTVGREKGIILAITSIGKSQALHEKLELIANGDPGAPMPPDIAFVYPKTAILLAKKNMLVDIGAYFTAQELSALVPRFLEEGRFLDGKLYVFPTNKSTEALIVNRTLFDRFAAETGAKLEDLTTVEGLLRVAHSYYDWTDAQTPDVPDDGKTFFMIDNPFNFLQVGYRQMGEDFFLPSGSLNLYSPVFKKVWDAVYEPSVKGHEAIYNGYGTDLTKTGDLVCWVSSTAGITFLPISMTYLDNTSEPVSFDILPYPVFEGGQKVAIQRGGGFCLIKSTKKKEDAAIVFLEWITEPANNLHFVEGSGYLPVIVAAMEKTAADRPKNISFIRSRFLDIVSLMNKEYDFYIPPVADNYEVLERRYDSLLRKHASASRTKFLKALEAPSHEAMNVDEAFRAASGGAYEEFLESLEE